MSSGKFFAGMPSINIPRSRWKTSYNVTGSYKHGYLNVVDALPILPGDGLGMAFKDITRMQTPIAPIFGNIKQHFVAFFVPFRLIWDHTEEHFGANKTSAGYQQVQYDLPTAKFTAVEVGSLAHQLGKPLKASADTDAAGKNYYVANILKERAYYLCWNEYFRAQQITNPVLINKTDSSDADFVLNKVATWNGSNLNPGNAPGTGSGSLMKVAKNFDCFTACTLSAQYGAGVELPLGTEAPIYIEAASALGSSTDFALSVTGNGGKNYDLSQVGKSIELADPTNIVATKMFANLTQATAAKVNDVRYAFAVQKYLERANFAGNYFFGILQVHYGVTSPDSRLQRPEFLGEFDEDILVHQVVATADTVNSGVRTSVGNTGAMSVTPSGLVNLFNKAFVEPGLIMIFRFCRHRQVYSQGIMKEDYKRDRFETYTPELCNLGDDFVRTREIYWKAGEKAIFGYQEHWYEYRYRPDRVTGALDPNGANSLDFWTLATKFSTVPLLNDDFIFESRDNIDRAIVTGSSQDEYISDMFIELTWTREMPVRTIPGLIDHFGAM